MLAQLPFQHWAPVRFVYHGSVTLNSYGTVIVYLHQEHLNLVMCTSSFFTVLNAQMLLQYLLCLCSSAVVELWM